MANAFYLLGKKSMLDGDFAFLSDNLKINLCSATYTPDFTTDQFLSIIPGGAILATSSNLGSKTTTLGTFNAANVTFTSVASGSTGTRIVLYKDTTNPATSRLIAAFDSYTNLPVVTNGGDIIVQWDTGTNKIFTLREMLERFRDWARGLIWTPDQELLWLPTPRVIQQKVVLS